MHELGEAAMMFVYLKVFETLFGLIMFLCFMIFVYSMFKGTK